MSLTSTANLLMCGGSLNTVLRRILKLVMGSGEDMCALGGREVAGNSHLCAAYWSVLKR